jgi:hypothetical protein
MACGRRRPHSIGQTSAATGCGGFGIFQGDPMSPRPFEPKFMKLSVLTAALQELAPRALRDRDPDRAVIDLLLDPVANSLDLRSPFDASRAREKVPAP